MSSFRPMTVRSLLLVLAVLLAGPARAQTVPVGDWSGTLTFGEQSLQMVLHVAAGDGGPAVTLDVPAQGGFGLPATSAEARNDSLLLRYDAFGARFALAVTPDSLHGRFAQGMADLPITFTPGEPLRRPQTPAPPFPYAEEDAAVTAADGATLAGTFVRPDGAGPFAAVLLLTGSGPQDRDESLFGHRPFAVLADALARAGVASLRLDDRGTGASTGDFGAATLDTHLADARAARAWLAARPDVRAVGVLGHSEGGITALRLAPDAAFVVALAGPTVSGQALYAEQQRRAARLAGVDSTDADHFAAAVGATLDAMFARPDADSTALAAAMTAALNDGLRPMSTRGRMALGLTGPAYPQVRDALIGFMLAPGFRSFAAYDPAADLAAVRVPTLMLYGGKDFQVPADQNAPPARAALAGVAGAEVVVVDDANHLFQTADTGALTEYGQIEETIAPATLARIVEWVRTASRP